MYLFYPIALVLGWYIYYYSQQKDLFYQAAISKLDLATQSEVAWKSLLESLSLNLYQGASEMQDELMLLNYQAQTSADITAWLTLAFTLLSGFFFYYLYISGRDNKVIYTNMILFAFICLAIGISTTMLNLVAFRDLPVLGRIVFKYDSKTIISVVQTLWVNQKYFIFLLLLTFSVIIPVVKLGCLLVVLQMDNPELNRKFIQFSDIIGKWSMTDVFVVAVLLAVFSMNADQSTDAWLGYGLYFFAAYAIASVYIGNKVSHIIHH